MTKRRRTRDPRPVIDIVGDESGTLDVPGRDGDAAFVVATVAIPNCGLPNAMLDLRRRTMPFLDPGAPEYFHAKEDTPLTRRDLLRTIAKYPVQCDITVIDKRNLPSVRLRPVDLYSHAWFEHLVHALPGLLVPSNSKARLMVARLNAAASAQGFAAAYSEATMIAYVPFMFWHQQKSLTRRNTRPMLVMNGKQHYFGPALLFGEGDPKVDRLLQVADVVAWAARRRWALGDSTYYNLISKRIRSERLITLTRCREKPADTTYRIGVMQPPSGLRSRVHRCHAVARYEVGPADTYQNLIAIQQHVHTANFEAARKFVAGVDDGMLCRNGYLGWPILRKTLIDVDHVPTDIVSGYKR
jgi:hypothetical protein